MKRKFDGDKEFKIIPEAKIVQGVMKEKWVNKDLRTGIKPISRFIIEILAGELDNGYGDVYATAYCDEHDEFDEKIGIDVCSAKLEMKNHLRLAKLYDRMHRALIEASMIVGGWCKMHTHKAKAIEKDLEEYHGRLPV